jgi:hypothetical protein
MRLAGFAARRKRRAGARKQQGDLPRHPNHEKKNHE